MTTLGIGLAALGVVTALLAAILFAPLPYGQPERLAVLWASTRPGATQPPTT